MSTYFLTLIFYNLNGEWTVFVHMVSEVMRAWATALVNMNIVPFLKRSKPPNRYFTFYHVRTLAGDRVCESKSLTESVSAWTLPHPASRVRSGFLLCTSFRVFTVFSYSCPDRWTLPARAFIMETKPAQHWDPIISRQVTMIILY